jgi:hypothetical protein
VSPTGALRGFAAFVEQQQAGTWLMRRQGQVGLYDGWSFLWSDTWCLDEDPC